MNKHSHIINQITEALENTVPTRDYVAVMQALRRCQELLSEYSVHVTTEGIQKDMRTYADSLNLFFEDVDKYRGIYFDVTNGYDPAAHLVKLGVIKPVAKVKDKRATQPSVKKKIRKGKK
jgi:hypothetical protein